MFGAPNLLLAYSEHWQTWQEDELEESLTSNKWHIIKEAIPFLQGRFYLFAIK